MSIKRVFLSLYAAVFISSLGLGILSPILPSYVEHFAASSTVLGLVFGMYSASRTIFMVPVGRLSDRIGRKVFIVTGLALFTVVSPLYIAASSTTQLMLVRFLQGIAAAMLMPVAMSYIGDLAPRGREGMTMGAFTSAFFAGLGFGPLIGGFLRDVYTMKAAFLGMGCMSLAALVITLMTLPPSIPGPLGATPDRERGKVPAEPVVEHLGLRLAALFLFRFSRAVGIGFTWVLMPLYAVNSLGLSSLQVGVLLSVNTFLTTFLQGFMGHVSDRIGHMRSISMGSLAAAAGMSIISWTTSFEGLVAVSLALGLAGAFIVPAGSALAVEIGRKKGMGSVMGIYGASLSLGTMLGPVAGGVITDLWGIQTVFPVGGIIGVAGWAFLCLTYGWLNYRGSQRTA